MPTSTEDHKCETKHSSLSRASRRNRKKELNELLTKRRIVKQDLEDTELRLKYKLLSRRTRLLKQLRNTKNRIEKLDAQRQNGCQEVVNYHEWKRIKKKCTASVLKAHLLSGPSYDNLSTTSQRDYSPKAVPAKY